VSAIAASSIVLPTVGSNARLTMEKNFKQLVRITSGQAEVEGMLEAPPHALGVVLFAHGSGSGRFSPRNNFVADSLHEEHIATLLIDLLTPQEDTHYQSRFDISLLTERLAAAVDWLQRQGGAPRLPIGLFGASTGAAAALQVAAMPDTHITAVVSRGGRPDLAGAAALARVRAPTLLIVGGDDHGVIELNKTAYDLLHCEKQLSIVPGATHLFEEPGTLEEVAMMAGSWFASHFAAVPRTTPPV
jgi:putative phosphoribosyl transferase